MLIIQWPLTVNRLLLLPVPTRSVDMEIVFKLADRYSQDHGMCTGENSRNSVQLCFCWGVNGPGRLSDMPKATLLAGLLFLSYRFTWWIFFFHLFTWTYMIEILSPRVIFIYPEGICVPSTYWAKGVEFKFMWINVKYDINYNLKDGRGCGYSFVSIVICRWSQYHHDSSYFPQSSKFSMTITWGCDYST